MIHTKELRMPYPNEMLEVLSHHYSVGLYELLVLYYLGNTDTTYVVTKMEIGKRLNIDRRNIAKVLKKLEAKKIIKVVGRVSLGFGRPVVMYGFTPEFMEKVRQTLTANFMWSISTAEGETDEQ